MSVKILTDRATLTAYASDGSIYAITPKAVHSVHTLQDIITAVALAHRKGLAVIPRGGGTGLAGGALGPGMILDFSNFRRILKIDPAGRVVHTQVGIIYEELDLALRRHNLFFPPDPSSGDSCQIGGMLANNASGPRSVKYGLTSHFVEELEIITASGERVLLRKLRLGSRELEQFLGRHHEFRRVLTLLQDNRELICSRWPKLKKNSAGYNLKQVIDDLDRGIYNLPALIVGSEGTLALIATATLSLLPLPTEKLTARVYFLSLLDAGLAVESILENDPSGLEIVDGATLDLIGRKRFDIPPEAAAMLLVEFDSDVALKKTAFIDLAARLTLAAPVEFAADPETAAALWEARRAIVPTLYRHHPTKRPVSIIEDISIPPHRIPAFIEYISKLLESHRLIFGISGHIGDGNLHIRPLFDLNEPEDLELAGRLYDTVYDHVIAIGGSTTAEHADGRLRAPVLKPLYGGAIYDIFRGIKSTLDPGNILSPECKIADISFSDRIDYEKIKSYCAACGKCNGYCPAYDIFRREDFSPRGWLRMLNQSGETRRMLNRHLDFCLNCKNCSTVCPAGVDIASEILRFRSGAPSRKSTLAVKLTDNETLLGLSLRMGRLIQPLINNPPGRLLMDIPGKLLFGIDRSFHLPVPERKTLRQRYPQRLCNSGAVALFHGCADNLLKSGTGDAVFAVFDRLGIEVAMPEQKCCGLPQEVHGHRDNLIEKARFNIKSLSGFEAIITGCASCLLRLREYPQLFSDDPEYKNTARKLAEKCFDISQFLNRLDPDYSIFDGNDLITVTYHNPCHLRAAGLHREPEKLLAKIANVRISHPVHADRCCAQAGSYGYFHFQPSREMFRKKKDAYAGIDAQYLMTSCPACQMKIRAELGQAFTVVHPIEILANRLAVK
ncbi:MAG: FAD-binding oxidoreductase [Candidatus Zixiibacteriota bacterium]|nr:MAG: FAD-binding oxidoreductase [candidate division Zixibacteria bacterium]